MIPPSEALAPAAAVMVLVAVLAGRPPEGRGLHRLVVAATGGRSGPEPTRTGRRPVSALGPVRLALVALGLVAGALSGGRLLVSLVAVGLILAVVVGQRTRHRKRRAAGVGRARVIEACTVLAADLRAGRTPQDALEGAATVCPDLRVAAAAARLGGDVGAALELAAASPGGGGLRALGAAWRVAERSGAAFATVADRLADSLRADETVRRQVSAGLAGTRSTARLLAFLPVFATLVGYGIGADPLTFLTGTPVGWLCLFAGLALAAAGLGWVERLADACEGTG